MHLVIQYFNDSNPARAKEYEACLKLNLENPKIFQVHDLIEEGTLPFMCEHDKHIVTASHPRLTFEHAFKYAALNIAEGETVMLCNLDIIASWEAPWETFDGKPRSYLINSSPMRYRWNFAPIDKVATLLEVEVDRRHQTQQQQQQQQQPGHAMLNTVTTKAFVKECDANKHYTEVQQQLTMPRKGEVLCLTRHEVKSFEDAELAADTKLAVVKSPHYWQAWCQDAFVFKNPIDVKGCDFDVGSASCDNAIAHRLLNSGYMVRNPANTFRIYHFDLARAREEGGLGAFGKTNQTEAGVHGAVYICPI